MCISDWRIARLVSVQSTAFDTAAATGLSYGANKQRVAIGFYVTSTITVAGNTPIIALDGSNLFKMNIAQQFIEFNFLEHGSLPQRAWSVVAGGAASTGRVIEYFLPEDVLAAAIQQFYSEYRL